VDVAVIALLGAALAADRSLDIELVHPRFVDGAIPGVDAIGDGDRGEVHTGAFATYTHDPLLLVGEGGTVAGVERNRLTVDLGGAWQATPGFGLRAGFPVITDWGTQVPELYAPGVGFGDLQLGVVVASAPRSDTKPRPLRAGGSLDVVLPIGTRDAWRGEEGARLVPGALVDLTVGRFTAAANVALVARGTIDTGADLRVGMQLLANAGIGWDVWSERVRVTMSVVDRFGLGGGGPGADSIEVLAGLQARTGANTRLDVYFGRGLNLGYGASDYRAAVGLTVHANRPPPPKPVVVPPPRLAELDEEEVEVVAVEGVTPPPPPALARVEQDEIILRDPIPFELGTDRILPDATPTLLHVAGLLRDHPEILEVVIEGHASEEGGFLYNYDLSLRRTSAIFKELVLAGVHPDRLACRSMGEVRPTATGAAEDALAQNRRVVFHITRRLLPGEPLPAYDLDILVPWTGEAAKIPAGPPLPAVLPPTPAPPPADGLPSRDLFEEEEEP
jgi:outer membrane protein OmpA-like peptidoglycan-associated protein